MAFLMLAAAAAAVPEAHEGGLPQLNTHTFAGQLFWLAIAFVILYALLSTLVIPRITGVLESRRARITGDLTEAAALKSQADRALKDYEAALAEARGRARALADETRNAIKAEADAKRAEAEAKLNADIAAAEARIAEMKASAMANVQTVAAETAVEIVNRLSGETVSPADAGAAVATASAR